MNVLRIYRPIYNTLNKMSYSNIMVSIHPDELYNLKGSIQTLEREYKKTINKINILEYKLHIMENKNRYNIEPKIIKLEDKVYN